MSVESPGEGVFEARLGDEVLVLETVTLKSLSSQDLGIWVLRRRAGSEGRLKDSVVLPMRFSRRNGASTNLSQSFVQSSARSESHGYAIRRLPKHADSNNPFLPGLSKWAQALSPVAELHAR